MTDRSVGSEFQTAHDGNTLKAGTREAESRSFGYIANPRHRSAHCDSHTIRSYVFEIEAGILNRELRSGHSQLRKSTTMLHSRR